MTRQEEKREFVFEAASGVFSNYGFRRTSMNDIANAAGISRPALYIMFENKEDLFRQLVTQRQEHAISEAVDVLQRDTPMADRIVEAVLAYERTFYEPVSASPHGAELMDMGASLALAELRKGHDRLVDHLARAIENAVSLGEVDLSGINVKPKAFVELLLSSVGGQKKSATSLKDFRRRIRDVGRIFTLCIASGAAGKNTGGEEGARR